MCGALFFASDKHYDQNNTRTDYQYDGSQMLTETTGSGSSQYLWGPGGLVRRDGEWPTTDGLGNTRLVTNGSQSITSTQMPDAYGGSITSSGSTSVPYQWGQGSGYRSDLDAGLIQVGARYYDRDSGRFITRDTDLGQSPYAYCGGDPINCTDPDGHQVKKKDDKKKSLTLAQGAAVALTAGFVTEATRKRLGPYGSRTAGVLAGTLLSGAFLNSGKIGTAFNNTMNHIGQENTQRAKIGAPPIGSW